MFHGGFCGKMDIKIFFETRIIMLMTYAFILVMLLVLELCYFKIADRFNIIDKPNDRSSHSTIVLRGGGIIFTLSMIAWAALMIVQGQIISGYFPLWQGDRSLAYQS